MVNLTDRKIILGEETFELTSFETWFQTPRGVCMTLAQAMQVCTNMDLDPELAIRPVPVALCTAPIESTLLAHEVMG